MNTFKATAILASAALLPLAASADHNSKWGEGWANMPNDIHNTRIDTRGDNTAFRDFVRNGNGADSVNRYATDSGRSQQSIRQRSQISTRQSSRSVSGQSQQRGRGGR